MSDKIDQIAFAREFSRLIVTSGELYGFDDAAIKKLLGDGKQFDALKNAWGYPSAAKIDETERNALLAAGFTSEFINEIAGEDGKKGLRARIKYLAENCAPPIITFFRKDADYYLHNILELKHFENDPEAEIAVPYLEKVLDTGDKGLVFYALRTLSSVGAPSVKTLETGAKYCAALSNNGSFYYSGFSVTPYECEDIFLAMLDRAKDADAALHAMEEYFAKATTINTDKFMERFTKHAQKAVPYLLRMLKTGSYISTIMALEALVQLDHHPTEEDKKELIKVYYNFDKFWGDNPSNSPQIAHSLLWQNKALAARLLFNAGERKYMDEVLDHALPHNGQSYIEAKALRRLGIGAFDRFIKALESPELSDSDVISMRWVFAEVVEDYADKVADRLIDMIDSKSVRLVRFALSVLQSKPSKFSSKIPRIYDAYLKKIYGYDDNFSDLLELKRSALKQVLADNWKEAAPLVMAGLKIYDPDLLVRTFDILEEAGEKAEAEFDNIVPFLDFPDDRVRLAAIRAIGAVGKRRKETIKVLARCLLDSEPVIIDAVIGALFQNLTDSKEWWPILPSLEHISRMAKMAGSAHQRAEALIEQIERNQL